MSIAQISPNSILATPAQLDPKGKSDQVTAASQGAQNAQKAFKAIKTDTVTISQEAVQKLASDGENVAMEAKESGNEKVVEKAQGKA